MNAEIAYSEVLRTLPQGSRVLDIGCGKGQHAEGFRRVFAVQTVDLIHTADILGDYLDLRFLAPFDCIWASHVLEHQRNVGAFLDKCRKDLKEGGLLAITVPPRKDEIVGGHVTLWNSGLLLYNLILARFDCSEADVYVQDYDISVLVRKREIALPNLKMDNGDIDRLAAFFPFSVSEGFDGCAVLPSSV